MKNVSKCTMSRLNNYYHIILNTSFIMKLFNLLLFLLFLLLIEITKMSLIKYVVDYYGMLENLIQNIIKH